MLSTGLLLTLTVACASRNRNLVLSPSFREKAPQRVAVLLFENQSLDLLAPDMLRAMTRERLGLRGYAGPALAEVDAALRDMGVSDGGQLRALKPQELGRVVGADGLLYGTIEEFNFTDVGFGTRKAVRMRLALVRAEDGEKLWENEAEEAKLGLRETKEEAGKGILESTVEKAIANMRKRPLYEQSRIVLDRLFSTLPTRR